MKKATNDQAELIENIKNKQKIAAWNKVKYIGYQDIDNMNMRFIIFNMTFNKFDPFINNNFIMFYKNALRNVAMSMRNKEEFTMVRTDKIANILKSHWASPKPLEDYSPIVQDMLEFSNAIKKPKTKSKFED